MMTLMILVSATWTGLYLAKRITRPVQLLAAGAREIGAGRLDHRIEPETRDEFGSLVEAFNTMAGELAASQRKLERSRVDLERKNLQLDERRRYIEGVRPFVGLSHDLSEPTSYPVWIINTGQPAFCNRISESPYGGSLIARTLKAQALLGLPLINRTGRVVGAMTFADMEDADRFTARDLTPGDRAGQSGCAGDGEQ